MVKIQVGRFAGRVTFNVIIAAIIFGILNAIMSAFEESSILVSSALSLAVLLWLVPFVLNKHPGEETLLSLVIALPVGITIVNLIGGLFNVELPALNVSEMSIFSIPFVLAVTSYFIADWIFGMWFGKKR